MRCSRSAWMICAGLLFAQEPTLAQGPQLQLEPLDRLAPAAVKTVNLSLDPAMLKLAGAILKDERLGDAATTMLTDLQGIYVRGFEFDRDNAYSPDDVGAVRSQLAGPGWTRVVEMNGRRTGEVVEMYSWSDSDREGGLAVIVAGLRALTIVNVVGRIDLTSLRALQGQLGFPPLPDITRPTR